MKIYEALYCSCIYESADSTLSTHKTREGAEKAIKEHKMKKYKEWRELYELDKLTKLHKQIKSGEIAYSDEYESLKRVHRFGSMQSWSIYESELLE